MSERGLSRLSMPDLRELLRAVERGQLAFPVTEAGLAACGLHGGHVAEVMAVLRDVPEAGVRAVLRVAIAEREHRPPRLELVWTGPEAVSTVARDTAIVIGQLFEKARRSVLVGGYSFDHGKEILQPLHAVMGAHGVQAMLFIDIKEKYRKPKPEDAEAAARAAIDQFFFDNWPVKGPRPEVYYDPRTAVKGWRGASMHAKCVVIDERETLITSANFTNRGQTRNVELGVLIEDSDFAQRVIGQWRGLIHAGLVRPYRG